MVAGGNLHFQMFRYIKHLKFENVHFKLKFFTCKIYNKNNGAWVHNAFFPSIYNSSVWIELIVAETEN